MGQGAKFCGQGAAPFKTSLAGALPWKQGLHQRNEKQSKLGFIEPVHDQLWYVQHWPRTLASA